MRQGLLLMLLATTVTLTACGSGTDDGSALDWPSTEDLVSTGGRLVWADQETGDIHLPDGAALAAERSITSFVMAGGGAYVVGADDDELIEVTADGTRATGAHTRGVTASPDGRYLAFIDTQDGPLFQKDPAGDVHLLTSVVVDLTTGDEIVRTTRGMGDPDEDDLTDLYEDASYGVLGVTDEKAWIQPATGDVLAVDLASGEITPLPDVSASDEANPWIQPTVPPAPIGGDWNADRSWGITHEEVSDPDDPARRQSRDILVQDDGTRLVPRPDAVSWRFDRWLDRTTVVGFADENIQDPDDPGALLPSSLLTCTVPDGSCTIVPDSDHALLPARHLS